MIVVKIGGGAGINIPYACRDIANLIKKGVNQFVLVHGGSALINEMAARLGHPPEFITSTSGHTSRRTDPETLKIFIMSCCGVNKEIVETLQSLGINAIGLSGIDGRLLEGRRKMLKVIRNGRRIVLRDDYTGKVERVNESLLRLLLENGYLPVVTPPAISTENEAINVDGDRVAAMIAAALKADSLVILSNVPGLLRNFPDESTLLPHINPEQIQEQTYAKGRMRIKMLAAGEAIEGGVGKVFLADGRIENPVSLALSGKGTVISARSY